MLTDPNSKRVPFRPNRPRSTNKTAADGLFDVDLIDQVLNSK